MRPRPTTIDTMLEQRKQRLSWLRRPWILPLAVVTAVFLTFRLPTYLSLDPQQSLSEIDPEYAWHYPLLVFHIFLGAIGLIAATLQVWPWLRQHRPDVHRFSGRVYVAVALPAAVAAVAIAQISSFGPVNEVANTITGVLWFGTTLAGYRAARRRDFGRHREWMIRSFALIFSIVMSRVWMPICLLIVAPEAFGGAELTPMQVDQLSGLNPWLSVTVNLLIAEWWLHRRPRRQRQADSRRTAVKTAGSASAARSASSPPAPGD